MTKVIEGLPEPISETTFAEGSTVETQNIRVTFELANPLRPAERFPRIYKTEADGTISKIGLTPAEAKFLADVFLRLC
jgi:hypothetical protein